MHTHQVCAVHCHCNMDVEAGYTYVYTTAMTKDIMSTICCCMQQSICGGGNKEHKVLMRHKAAFWDKLTRSWTIGGENTLCYIGGAGDVWLHLTGVCGHCTVADCVHGVQHAQHVATNPEGQCLLPPTHQAYLIRYMCCKLCSTSRKIECLYYTSHLLLHSNQPCAMFCLT